MERSSCRTVKVKDWQTLCDEIVDLHRRINFLRDGLDHMICAESEVVRNHALKVVQRDNQLRDK